MRLVAEEWAREAVQELRAATEWPHNLKFFLMESVNAIAIGPSRVWHMDLINRIKDECGPLEIDDQRRGYEGYTGGHIEFEEDGTYTCRNELGTSLPSRVQLELNEILADLLKETP